ncbi:MAG: CU044_2847 family protein [Bacteroidota bacterium]
MPTFTIEENSPILVELTSRPGVQKTALLPADIAEKSAKALENAMNTIHSMAQRITNTMDALVKKPSQVELEFGIKLDVESGALIAKAGAEAHLNVKLIWEHKERSA